MCTFESLSNVPILASFVNPPRRKKALADPSRTDQGPTLKRTHSPKKARICVTTRRVTLHSIQYPRGNP